MPITTLDRNCALIVVDLQVGTAGAPTIHPFDDVLQNAATLADAFRSRDLPVVLVNAAGAAPGRTERGGSGRQRPEGWTELLPELNRQPGDTIITKYTWGAFHKSGLAEHLTELGVTQVVVCGVATAMGVESTARQAHEHGFHVALATDAMTDTNPAAHENSLSNIFPMLGETGTSADVVAQLDRRDG